MKSHMFIRAVSVLIATGVFAAAEQTLKGTISDRMCGATHTMKEHSKKKMTDRECTQACASHGMQYVLVADGKVYKLRNRDADLRMHAGHVVNLTGDLQSDNTIRVAKVEMLSQ